MTSQELEAKDSLFLGKADLFPIRELPSHGMLWDHLVSLALILALFCFLESRCDKDLDTLSGYALCLPNLARLQTYHFAEHRPILCVEIKVKFCQGRSVWGKRERLGQVVNPYLSGVHFPREAPGSPHAGPHSPFSGAPSSQRLSLLPTPSMHTTCTLLS